MKAKQKCMVGRSGRIVLGIAMLGFTVACASGVQAQMPDLVIDDVWTVQGRVDATDMWPVNVSVRNQGSDVAGVVTIGIYLSQDTEFTINDLSIGVGNVGALNPGETVNTAIQVQTGPRLAGIFYLGAVADPGNQVDESDETNNTLLANTNRPGGQLLVRALTSRGVVGFWTFEGNPDPTYNDASGRDNHGTFQNDPLLTTGRFGLAYEFNGIDQDFVVQSSEWLKFGTGSFSIAAWFQTVVDPPEAIGVVCKDATPQGPAHYSIRVQNGGRPQFTLRDKDNYIYGIVVANDSYVDGEWHHMAGVKDSAGGQLRLYVDGVLAASAPDNPSVNTDGDAPLFIGSRYHSEWFFGGKIDDVVMFNRALSDPEVVRLASDSNGNSVADFWECIVPPIVALIDLDPDTLNRKSQGHWVTCYVTLPAGYSVADIDPSSIEITKIVGTSYEPSYTQPIDSSFVPQVGDRDEDGITDLTVKFDRQILIGNLCLDDVSITVEGDLTTGEHFAGMDTIRVIERGK